MGTSLLGALGVLAVLDELHAVITTINKTMLYLKCLMLWFYKTRLFSGYFSVQHTNYIFSELIILQGHFNSLVKTCFPIFYGFIGCVTKTFDPILEVRAQQTAK